MARNPKEDLLRNIDQSVIDLLKDTDGPVLKFMKDLRDTSKMLTADQASYLVRTFYQIQEQRMRFDAQKRRLEETGQPCKLFDFFSLQTQRLEKQLQTSLDLFSDNHPVGQWSRSILGIGPVLASGLLAHIKIERVKYAGQIWSYAGLNPNMVWQKGQKRPFNQDLKVICFKIGQSFVYVSNNEKSFYGKMFKKRKKLEVWRNENGYYKEEAEKIRATKKLTPGSAVDKATKIGKLSADHIQKRSARWATKLYLAHWYEVAYDYHNQADPPDPYPMKYLGHDDYIPPPNFDKTRPHGSRIVILDVPDQNDIIEMATASTMMDPEEEGFIEWFKENDYYGKQFHSAAE